MTVTPLSPSTGPPVMPYICGHCGKVSPGTREDYVPLRAKLICTYGYCACKEGATTLAKLDPATRAMYAELAPTEPPEPKAIEAPQAMPEAGEEPPTPPLASSMPYPREITPEVVTEGVRRRMAQMAPPPMLEPPEGTLVASDTTPTASTSFLPPVTAGMSVRHPLADMAEMWRELDAEEFGPVTSNGKPPPQEDEPPRLFGRKRHRRGKRRKS